MRRFGKMGVTLALSLILSVTLFTSSAFAQRSSYAQREVSAHSSTAIGVLTYARSIGQRFSIQHSGNPQASDQQTNYQQDDQAGDACSWLGNCQHTARCTHIFRSPWGWIFICHGW